MRKSLSQVLWVYVGASFYVDHLRYLRLQLVEIMLDLSDLRFGCRLFEHKNHHVPDLVLFRRGRAAGKAQPSEHYCDDYGCDLSDDRKLLHLKLTFKSSDLAEREESPLGFPAHACLGFR